MSTPNRGYVYPDENSPALVPDHLEQALGQVDADVQTLVDQLEGTVRINPDGSLPEAVEERVEQIAVEYGSPAGSIPVFSTLAEAQAWELANPGRVALTIEPPPDPSAWQAAAPGFDIMSGTVTIPSDAGATYTVNGVATAAGTHAVTVPSTVTVAAVAKDGYTLAGVMEWVQEFEENPVPYDGPASAAPFYFRLDEPSVHTGAPQNRGISGANPWSINARFARYGEAGAGVGATAVGGSTNANGSIPQTRWWLDDSTAPTAYTFAVAMNYQGSSPGLTLYRDWSQGKKIEFNQVSEETILPNGTRVTGFEGIHHVAFTWDGTTRRIYLDGELHLTDQMTWATTAGVVLAERAGATTTTTFAGLVIDRSRAWTQAEIQALSEAVTR